MTRNVKSKVKTWATGAAGVALGAALTVSVASWAQGAGDDLPARTIPYEGYIDFDGEPVNANVKMNFALFVCEKPGTQLDGSGAWDPATACWPAWMAAGSWQSVTGVVHPAGLDAGWPGTSSNPIGVDVPVFSGRFSVELGGLGMEPIADSLFLHDGPLYLALNIEGAPMAKLQRINPAPRAFAAGEAQNFRVLGLLEANELQANKLDVRAKSIVVSSTGDTVGNAAPTTLKDTWNGLRVRDQNDLGAEHLTFDNNDINLNGTSGTLEINRISERPTRIRGALRVDGNITNAVNFTGRVNGLGHDDLGRPDAPSSGTATLRAGPTYSSSTGVYGGDVGIIGFTNASEIPQNEPWRIYRFDVAAGASRLARCPKEMYVCGLLVHDIDGDGTNAVMLSDAVCCKVY